MSSNQMISPDAQPFARYYEPSGVCPPEAIGFMLGIGFVTALVLGYIYTYISYYNPFIYINFIATIIFGGALGVMVSIAGQMGKNRSPKMGLIFGLIVGFIGLQDFYQKCLTFNRPVVIRKFNVSTHTLLHLIAWIYVAVVGWELYLVYR